MRSLQCKKNKTDFWKVLIFKAISNMAWKKKWALCGKTFIIDWKKTYFILVRSVVKKKILFRLFLTKIYISKTLDRKYGSLQLCCSSKTKDCDITKFSLWNWFDISSQHKGDKKKNIGHCNFHKIVLRLLIEMWLKAE